METPNEPVVAENATEAPSAPVEAPEAPTNTNAPAPAEEPPKEPATAETEPVIATVDEDVKYSEGAKFGDYEVEVSIPADLLNYGAEKGVDIQQLSKELYSSDDFTLSEESLQTAYDAFGKWQVDTYLNGLKASNEALVGKHTAEVEARSVAEKEAWESTLEIMGGEDRWEDLSAYATQNLSDAEIEEFNDVMENGSLRMQQLMIKDVYGKFAEAGAPVAPTVLDLEEGGTGGDPTGGEAPLSASAFLELMRTGEYKNDPQKYDALRRAGMAKGI